MKEQDGRQLDATSLLGLAHSAIDESCFLLLHHWIRSRTLVDLHLPWLE